jgi:hypothetical protein
MPPDGESGTKLRPKSLLIKGQVDYRRLQRKLPLREPSLLTEATVPRMTPSALQDGLVEGWPDTRIDIDGRNG